MKIIDIGNLYKRTQLYRQINFINLIYNIITILSFYDEKINIILFIEH